MDKMTVLSIHLDGDNCWPDMIGKDLEIAEKVSLAYLRGGMQSGEPSIAIRLDLPGNKVVFAQTSLKLLQAATDAFKTKRSMEYEEN